MTKNKKKDALKKARAQIKKEKENTMVAIDALLMMRDAKIEIDRENRLDQIHLTAKIAEKDKDILKQLAECSDEQLHPEFEADLGHKDTKGKLKLNLVPPRAIRSMALVREFGVNKYKDPWGWKSKVTVDEFVEAAKRHILAVELGDELDPESGLLHLEHALTSLAMAIEIKTLDKK